jgi:hypothetical protein
MRLADAEPLRHRVVEEPVQRIGVGHVPDVATDHTFHPSVRAVLSRWRIG